METVPKSDYDIAVRIIGFLLEELGGHTRITNEELEDAPDVEIRDLFETDEIEMRTVRREHNLVAISDALMIDTEKR